MVSQEIEAELKAAWIQAELQGESEMLVAIGSLDPSRAAFGFEDGQQLEAAGLAWVSRQTAWLRSNICKSDVIKDFSKATATDLLVPVFGLLQTKFGQALALFATIIVIRRLLEGFCQGAVEA